MVAEGTVESSSISPNSQNGWPRNPVAARGRRQGPDRGTDRLLRASLIRVSPPVRESRATGMSQGSRRTLSEAATDRKNETISSSGWPRLPRLQPSPSRRRPNATRVDLEPHYILLWGQVAIQELSKLRTQTELRTIERRCGLRRVFRSSSSSSINLFVNAEHIVGVSTTSLGKAATLSFDDSSSGTSLSDARKQAFSIRASSKGRFAHFVIGSSAGSARPCATTCSDVTDRATVRSATRLPSAATCEATRFHMEFSRAHRPLTAAVSLLAWGACVAAFLPPLNAPSLDSVPLTVLLGLGIAISLVLHWCLSASRPGASEGRLRRGFCLRSARSLWARSSGSSWSSGSAKNKAAQALTAQPDASIERAG